MSKYWDEYYERAELRVTPSQFAVFVFDEVAADAAVLIDVGCGDGRDTYFFAQTGVPAIGVDASSLAIERCVARSEILELPVSFLCMAADAPGLAGSLKRKAAEMRKGDGPLVVYARFFIHAIRQSEELGFLDAVADLMEPGDTLALEYRTLLDKDQRKITGRHYRRFIDPMNVIARAFERGLKLVYFTEGFGYARLRGEDAHVARCLFTK